MPIAISSMRKSLWRLTIIPTSKATSLSTPFSSRSCDGWIGDRGLSTDAATVDDLARFVMNWFVAHIMVSDMQLGTFLGDRLCRERSPFEFETHRLTL